MAGLVKRNGMWHMRMRVPVRYRRVERRSELHRSLKTGDEKQARAKAAVAEMQIIAELDARLAGQETPASISHYEAMASLTSARGMPYNTAKELSEGKVEDILERVEALEASKDAPGSIPAKALLGSVDRPRPTLKQVAENMPANYPEEVRYKTPKQRNVWAARWTRPALKMIDFLGRDPAFADIQRQDALDFVNELRSRVLRRETKGASAQKDIQNLNLLWKKYHLSIGIDEVDMRPSPFRGLADGLDRNDEVNRKKEVPTEYIKRIVAPGALDTLNQDLADIILVLVETGCRQNEVTDIPAQSVVLDHIIPHLWLKLETGDDPREVKNKITARRVPLVGVALDAMKRHPQGFPRYRGKGTFSASANKRLKELNLLPQGVTVGGLRHSFETRLKEVGVQSDDRGELMGHSVKRIRGREYYGDEMKLERRQELHLMIAIGSKRG
ncbi:DUF6538 domain-containing protein [Phaeobacter inhibens]|uniref:DUF6538 domain-containing protein n=1 Tax=Phaeobacter inhibens TaxID=221822 RepID=UPI000C9CF42E